MDVRDAALATLRQRLEHVVKTQSAAELLEAPAIAEAAALVRAADTAGQDIEAFHMLGMFHWFRIRELSYLEGQEDFQAAVKFLMPVYRKSPEAVPKQLHSFVTDAIAAADSMSAVDRGMNLIESYKQTGQLPQLLEAIALYREAIHLVPAEHPNRSMYLNLLSSALHRQFRSTEELALLIEAVAMARQAVAHTPADHPFRAVHLGTLGYSLHTLSERTDDVELLGELVTIARQVVEYPDHADLAASINNLSVALQALYRRTQELDLLTEAVATARQAVHHAPAGHLDRPTYLSNLGSALVTLSGRTREVEVVSEAESAFRRAMEDTPAGHADHPRHSSNLSVTLLTLFERTGKTEFLSEAVAIARQVLEHTPADHPDRAVRLNNLGAALQALFERNGEAELLAEAVSTAREAMDLTSPAHHDRAARLNNLSIALQMMGGQIVDAELLTEAVAAARQAVERTHADHPSRAARLSNLGSALRALFERNGETEPLADAVAIARQVAAETPADHPDRAPLLDKLGTTLQILFERTGEMAVLAEAIAAIRQAVEDTSPDHPKRAGYLNALGNALHALYGRSGEVGHIAEAVASLRQAVEKTPADHPNRARFQNNLGITLRTLHEHTGEARLLTEAVTTLRQAVEQLPTEHPAYSQHLNNFGITLRTLSQRTGEAGPLAEAVTTLRRAVERTRADDPARTVRLTNLGVALQDQFERTGELDPLIEAAAIARDALEQTPVDHPDRIARLNNLGVALRILSERTGKMALLADAVAIARQVVDHTPVDRPERATYLYNLGDVLHLQSERDKDVAVQRESLACYRAASEARGATALTRVRALRRFISLAATGSGDREEVLAAVETAAGLLPQISPRTLARNDREYQLGSLGSLAEIAAAAALTAGNMRRAVELLEATRGILIADKLDARSSDLTALRQSSPALAGEFETLRNRRELLDRQATDQTTSRHFAEDTSRERVDAQDKWDQLVERIRTLRGFGDFLAAPDIARLAKQAGKGPIVFIFASSARCDALILTDSTRGPVQTVPLPTLVRADAIAQANRLRTAWHVTGCTEATAKQRIAAQGEILDVLAWLWDTTAGPVLAALGHTRAPADGESWPRIWWCPVGIMAYLPLHAAGHHRDLSVASNATDTARAVLDRVLSSYTPTVRALGYARSHPPTATTAHATLVVAVPDAPGMIKLEGVAAEADAITSLIPDANRLDRPGRDDVLAMLPTHPVAHFACHGLADWSDPGESCLILHDYNTRPLTVSDINDLRLTGALAYLSACDTASGSPSLADESLHLSGAFHLAGFQNVIGTLLPVSDYAALGIASDFYAYLTENGSAPPDTGTSALALHNAIRSLRAKYPAVPSYWAAHTHTGI